MCRTRNPGNTKQHTKHNWNSTYKCVFIAYRRKCDRSFCMFHWRTVHPQYSVLRLRSSGCWALRHRNMSFHSVWWWPAWPATARRHVLPTDHWWCMDRCYWRSMNDDHILQHIIMNWHFTNTKHIETTHFNAGCTPYTGFRTDKKLSCGEIVCVGGRYAVQGHSRSVILVNIKCKAGMRLLISE